jgi:hypothetical protein
MSSTSTTTRGFDHNLAVDKGQGDCAQERDDSAEPLVFLVGHADASHLFVECGPELLISLAQRPVHLVVD